MKQLIIKTIIVIVFTSLLASCRREALVVPAEPLSSEVSFLTTGGWRITRISTDLNNNNAYDYGEPVEDATFYDDVLRFSYAGPYGPITLLWANYNNGGTGDRPSGTRSAQHMPMAGGNDIYFPAATIGGVSLGEEFWRIISIAPFDLRVRYNAGMSMRIVEFVKVP
jgi:hypothetical protein